MKRYVFLSGIIVLVLILLFCGYVIFWGRFITSEFEDLHGVDQIKLTVLLGINEKGVANDTRPIRTINDPEEIDLVITQMRTFSNGWQYEGFSPPWTTSFGRTGPVQIGFYAKGKLKILFKIGHKSNEPYYIQELGGPGKYLDYEEFREIMELLEIDETYADYQFGQ